MASHPLLREHCFEEYGEIFTKILCQRKEPKAPSTETMERFTWNGDANIAQATVLGGFPTPYLESNPAHHPDVMFDQDLSTYWHPDCSPNQMYCGDIEQKIIIDFNDNIIFQKLTLTKYDCASDPCGGCTCLRFNEICLEIEDKEKNKIKKCTQTDLGDSCDQNVFLDQNSNSIIFKLNSIFFIDRLQISFNSIHPAQVAELEVEYLAGDSTITDLVNYPSRTSSCRSEIRISFNYLR